MNGEFLEESDKIKFEIINAVNQKRIVLVYEDDRTVIHTPQKRKLHLNYLNSVN